MTFDNILHLSTENKLNWLTGIMNIPTQEVNFDTQPSRKMKVKF